MSEFLHYLKGEFRALGLGGQIMLLAMLWSIFWAWVALQDCRTGSTERYIKVFKPREWIYDWLHRAGWIVAVVTFIIMFIRA